MSLSLNFDKECWRHQSSVKAHLQMPAVLLQDASARGLPIASCLDIWGAVETPAGSPTKSLWFFRGSSKDSKPVTAAALPAGSA